MNLFDILIIIGLVAGSAWGFIKGVIHQLIGVALLYVSLIVATMFYSELAPPIAQIIKLPMQPAKATAFLALLIIAINVIGFAVRKVRKKEVKMLRLVNQLGGMTLGFGMACVWIAVILAALHYASAAPVTWRDPAKPQLASVPSESIRLAIVAGLDGSPLVRAISAVLPLIVRTVSPFVPTGDILSIFTLR